MAHAFAPVPVPLVPASQGPADVNPSSAADLVDAALRDGPGYLVFRSVVTAADVEKTLRMLNLEIVRAGLTPDEIARCAQSTFFPHLRWEPPLTKLRDDVEQLVRPRPSEEWADTQVLLRFPDEAPTWPLTSHVDGLPHWASERSYRAVVGVALSASYANDGCLAVWPWSHRGADTSPVLVELDVGDVVVMHPELAHSSTLNTGGRIRYAAYFRLLAAVEDRDVSAPRQGEG